MGIILVTTMALAITLAITLATAATTAAAVTIMRMVLMVATPVGVIIIRTLLMEVPAEATAAAPLEAVATITTPPTTAEAAWAGQVPPRSVVHPAWCLDTKTS